LTLAGPFLEALTTGSILFVDELEARLHPRLTRAVVSQFNSYTNDRDSQLIFASHDAGLLDSKRIRRDQAWFIEKDDFGASRLYSLADFRVRKDAKFEKEYLFGQFGGVPRIRNFQDIPSMPLNNARPWAAPYTHLFSIDKSPLLASDRDE